MMPRPALPKLPLAGVVNTEGSNHCVTVRGIGILPFTSGRRVVVLVLVGSGPLITGVNQLPVLMLKSVLSCQPESSIPRPSGNSYNAWFIHWWRGTEYTLPRSRRRLYVSSMVLLSSKSSVSSVSLISFAHVHVEVNIRPLLKRFCTCVCKPLYSMLAPLSA